MTAGADQAALAADAVALGMAAAEDYMAAAARTPGLGFQVALPGVVGALGRPTQGEGYNLPASTPALRPVPYVSAQPSYGSPLVGGQSVGGSVGAVDALEGVPMTMHRASGPRPGGGALFVTASSGHVSLLDRIKAAFGVLLGRG